MTIYDKVEATVFLLLTAGAVWCVAAYRASARVARVQWQPLPAEPEEPVAHHQPIPHELLDPRRAGRVRRYHNEVVIQVQTDADHAWNVARLLLAVWPEAPRALLVEALLHDLGEGVAGDSPGPAKRLSPPLSRAVHGLELRARDAMAASPWGVPPRHVLTPEEAAVLSVVDLLEAWEHLTYEVSLGSRFAGVMVRRCEEVLPGLLARVPADVRARAEGYMVLRRDEEARR